MAGREGARVVRLLRTGIADRRQARCVHERADRVGRPGDHRVHVRHDRPQQGHGAHASRSAGGGRHVRALRAQAGQRRHLHRVAADRVHVRARRAGAVSDAIRRVDGADRAGVAAAVARGHPEVSRHDHDHVADGVSRDAQAGRRVRSYAACGSACRPGRRCRRRRSTPGSRRRAFG